MLEIQSNAKYLREYIRTNDFYNRRLCLLWQKWSRLFLPQIGASERCLAAPFHRKLRARRACALCVAFKWLNLMLWLCTPIHCSDASPDTTRSLSPFSWEAAEIFSSSIHLPKRRATLFPNNSYIFSILFRSNVRLQPSYNMLTSAHFQRIQAVTAREKTERVWRRSLLSSDFTSLILFQP